MYYFSWAQTDNNITSVLSCSRLISVPFQYTTIQVYSTNIWTCWQWGWSFLPATPWHQGRTFWSYKDAQADWTLLQCWGKKRGIRLLAFSNVVPANTLGLQKPSRRWKWHTWSGKHHNQIDYILVRKRFRQGVNIHRIRSFPGTDIWSDDDLVMMIFRSWGTKMRHAIFKWQ